ncbi:MAG: hypothetical protein IRY99_06560 [Isosphaeraceae bacterium]|nr:hypothetical protein [Isosphaeraceae bacterium]
MASTAVPELYLHDRFLARKKFFTLFGASFHLWSLDGRLLAFSRQKAFRLREDIRVYADEAQANELLLIQADRVIDWGAAYRVLDSQTGEVYGSLRRKGFKSMFRDSWEILDPLGNVRGRVIEDSTWKALVRRTVELATLLMPQKYLIEVDGQTVATMKQNFNVFIPKFDVDLSLDTARLLPRPLAIAAVILLLAIEGRQNG